ncbi:MAG TPA: Ku protein [Nitrospiraceae bacterium]|nr:Ku protein [Nitrospiraceae bacterium]
MPHKLESAHVSFGLVTIPVGIYSAIEEQHIHFNQFHRVCGSRIKQRRFCPTCNRDVVQLIESISSPAFDANAYHDDYRERVMELIEEKSKGNTLKLQPKAARPATDVVDLMRRLNESMAQTAQKKGARGRAVPAQASAKKTAAGRR